MKRGYEMRKVKVTCDSTCDLSEELIKKYDITVMPLTVILGEREFSDGVNVSAFDIFDFVKANNVLPKTAAVSVGEYREVFKKYVDAGYDVVHIDISAKMSSCFQNANIVAEELGHVYPVDSMNLSSGSGHLAIAAAELAAKGKSGEEIKIELDEMAKRLEVSFVVDTLEYLHKGGRCSSIATLGANLLKLRPCIEVKDGEMGVGKKYRGNMEKALSDYVSERLEGRKDLQLNRIFITHTQAPEEIVKHVEKLVKKYQPFAEIIETKAGCTVTSHCGRGTLGILFFTKK